MSGQCPPSPRSSNMCKLCLPTFLLLVTLAFTDAFFLPIFVRKQEPQTPAVNNNVGWGRSPSAPQSPIYKDYPSYSPMQQMAMSMPAVQQYSYEPPYLMNPFKERQYENIQLVPCMCPLTDEMDKQRKRMMQSMQLQASGMSVADSTKLDAVSTGNKAT